MALSNTQLSREEIWIAPVDRHFEIYVDSKDEFVTLRLTLEELQEFRKLINTAILNAKLKKIK